MPNIPDVDAKKTTHLQSFLSISGDGGNRTHARFPPSSGVKEDYIEPLLGLLVFVVNVIRDSLTGCRYPGWYPQWIRQCNSLSVKRDQEKQDGSSSTP